MRITKWVDMGAEVEVEIGVDDIRCALVEAFSASNQNLEEPVNIHDILRAFSNIGSFLRAFTDEQIAMLNDAQRKIIGDFLKTEAERFTPKRSA